MKTTLSVIKADIGSIGGHIKPSHQLLDRTREFVINNSKGLIDDIYVSHTGDDIALLFSHQKGTGNEDVHKLAWDAFLEGTKVAKEQGTRIFGRCHASLQ
ncbi:MAG: fructose 1,6-bisphosphatase [Deltaproteobacteria bacterium]|nr:fructose 1,6-bisphosphatase [Deltaproteobacteria bacterium]